MVTGLFEGRLSKSWRLKCSGSLDVSNSSVGRGFCFMFGINAVLNDELTAPIHFNPVNSFSSVLLCTSAMFNKNFKPDITRQWFVYGFVTATISRYKLAGIVSFTAPLWGRPVNAERVRHSVCESVGDFRKCVCVGGGQKMNSVYESFFVWKTKKIKRLLLTFLTYRNDSLECLECVLGF